MISAGYKSAYQQGYSDAKRDFRKKSKTDVLDRLRAEIEKQEKWLLRAGCTAYNLDIAFDAIKSVVAESEGEE